MRIPQTPPQLEAALRSLSDRDALPKLLGLAPVDDKGRWLHWDELRRRTAPHGLTLEQWWGGMKLQRAGALKAFGLLDRHGRPFRVASPDVVLRSVHHVDKHTAGQILLEEAAAHSGSRDRYLMSALFEEAITSSQLEGAVTTRQAAKAMLRSGRSPRTRSEQMIVNNFVAMQRIRELRDDPLTPEIVLAIQEEVTRAAIDDPSAAGRLRRADEDIKVVDAEGHVLHVPPQASELERRLEAMCTFANADGDQSFIHPVVRSILLHLWLAYDHPFVDGNGRTARTLFYWSMLRRGYWLFEFIPISRILRGAPARYARAFLHTETDDNDATYFVIHQLGVIEQAIEDLQIYLRKKMREQKSLREILRASVALNHRQRALLTHARSHPDTAYTIAAHQRSQNVAYQTARTDLLDLEQRGLFVRVATGRRKLVFEAAPDLQRKLERMR
jgi:Fic family protein